MAATFGSVQRYDQQITVPYYKQLLHECLNNTFMHGQHVAYHGNCLIRFELKLHSVYY